MLILGLVTLSKPRRDRLWQGLVTIVGVDIEKSFPPFFKLRGWESSMVAKHQSKVLYTKMYKSKRF